MLQRSLETKCMLPRSGSAAYPEEAVGVAVLAVVHDVQDRLRDAALREAGHLGPRCLNFLFVVLVAYEAYVLCAGKSVCPA